MQINNRVHIIQPTIPKYRVDFFERLNKELGNKLHLYCSVSWPNAPAFSNFKTLNPILFLKVFSVKNLFFYQQFMPILKKITANDIVIISGNPRIISNYFIIAYCKLIGAKIVWWGHGWSAGSRGFLSKIRQKLMTLSDAVLLYTDDEKDRYQQSILLNHPVFALNNGVNLEEIGENFQLDWEGYNKRGNVAIFCGRLAERSNILLLIKAVEQSKLIDKLIIIGDGELFEKGQDYIAANNLSEKIEMLGAIYEAKILSEQFSRASIFVFPGTVGLALIHAMAHGIPAILHDSNENHGPEHAAANTENSLLFIMDDNKSLADAIDSFFDKNKDARLAMAKAARYTVEEKFNTRLMANNFLEMVNKINGC